MPIVPVSEIQDSSKQANPMFSSIPIHIHLTTSINIRLVHGSHTTVANTRFHKKGQAYQKTFRKRLLVPLSNLIQSPKKSLYIHWHPNKWPPNGGDNDAIHQLDKLNSFPAIAFELYSSMARALGL